MDIEQIAVHEAGHAVAHIKLRMPMKSVSIVPDKETNGRVIPGNYRAMQFQYFKETPSGEFVARTEADILEIASRRLKRRVQRDIKMCFAGLAAQRLFFPDSDWELAGQDDYAEAVRLFNEGGLEGGPNDCMVKYIHRADKLVFKYAYEIAVVAEELLEYRTLSAKQVRTLVNGIDPLDPFFSPTPKLYADLVNRLANAA